MRIKDKEKVILVHGFNKNKADMDPLRESLDRLGYDSLAVNLPTTFASLEECTNEFRGMVNEILSVTSKETKIHLVGHSFGGLVIRSFLSSDQSWQRGRCILIATPNKGTKLADLVGRFCKPVLEIFKPLKAMRTKKWKDSRLSSSIETGVIAGNKNNLVLGFFLEQPNDGRVEVDSAKISDMKDFAVLNYGHKEIHHQWEVAELVNSFIQRGSFKEYSLES